MAKLGILTGTSPNDGTGDTLLSGAVKINSNFNEIYSCIGNGTSITNSIAYSILSGVSTYSQSSGIATYASTAGIATYAATSGIATYATTSGISTNSQGLTGTPNVSVGIITASGGFITSSVTPGRSVQLVLNGSVLTLNVVGVGSTNFQLS
jgi:hypothetical protein